MAVFKADFVTKTGDTGVKITGTLSDTNGVVDLTGGSIAFNMVTYPAITAKITDAAGTITDAANGAVEYEFSASDVDTVGRYLGEWKFTDGSGKITRFPRVNTEVLEDKYINILVQDGLGS